MHIYEYTIYGEGQRAGELESSPSARFTGKPYDVTLAAYVFPYRNYDPITVRWRSSDPIGFPDGPNNHYYAAIPTVQIDPLGLWTTDQYFLWYYIGEGQSVTLIETGDLDIIKHSNPSKKALKYINSKAENAVRSSWSSGASYKLSGEEYKSYNYEFVVYPIGNSSIKMSYNIKVRPQNDSNKWKYKGTATFVMNDAFKDVVDIFNIWEDDIELQ